jgi:hypothetical protein
MRKELSENQGVAQQHAWRQHRIDSNGTKEKFHIDESAAFAQAATTYGGTEGRSRECWKPTPLSYQNRILYIQQREARVRCPTGRESRVERETAEQKAESRKERIDGWRTNISRARENIARRVFGWIRREHTRLFKRESVREEKSKETGRTGRVEITRKERWKRTLFESQTNPSYSIKRKESEREVVGLEKGAHKVVKNEHQGRGRPVSLGLVEQRGAVG